MLGIVACVSLAVWWFRAFASSLFRDSETVTVAEVLAHVGAGPPRDNSPLLQDNLANPGMADEAVSAALRLAKRFPRSSAALDVAAQVCLVSGQSDMAVILWKSAIELDAADAKPYMAIAQVLTERGDHAAAEVLLREALSLEPSSHDGAALLAHALFSQGKMSEVVSLLEVPASHGTISTPCLLILSQAYVKLGRYEAAKHQFEIAAQREPQNPDAVYGLAIACTRLGHLREASEHQRSFRVLTNNLADHAASAASSSIDPDGERTKIAFQKLAQFYATSGDLQEAEKYLAIIARRLPNDPECRQQLLTLLRQQGRLDRAVDIALELVRIQPDDVWHKLKLGVLYADQGNWKDAESLFLEVCSKEPNRAIGFASLSRLYLDFNKDSRRACEFALKAVELEPTAHHYDMLSTAYERSGDRQQALLAVQHAIRLAPENGSYRHRASEFLEGP